jgi:PAS domain S-box-containing protein
LKARPAKRSSAARTAGTAELRARLRRAEQRLREVEERYEIAMAAINESVYEWDIARDRFTYSESMQRVIGLPPKLLRTLGDWQKRVHPEDFAPFRAATIAHLKGITQRLECDYRYRALDGSWRWARTHGAAIRDKNGRAVRLIGSTGDITELKRTEEALKQSQERYDLAMRAINEGVYEWNIVNGTAYFSERVYEVLNLTPADFKGPADWRGRIHPDDLLAYDAALIAHFKGERDRFECDYRYRAHDGSWRWARQHGVAVRDAKGRAVRMTGSAGDITNLKQAEEALRKSEERYALATAAAVEGIYEWDVESGRLFLTERAKEFFSFPAEELTPAAWNVRVHAEDYPRYRAAIVEHFKGRTDHLEIEYRIVDASGGYKWVLDRGKAVRDANGRATKMVGALSDITHRKHAEIELRRARDEATEALEQQTATSDILRVISGSLTDLGPVFDTILDNAVRLCAGNVAVLWRYDGAALQFTAHKGASPQGIAYLKAKPLPLGAYNPTPQAGLERRTIHVLDVFAEPGYWPLVPQNTFTSLPNSGTVLAVPLLKDDQLLGVITIWRFEKRMFTPKQVEMVTTFAAQAVIAIENVRLFNETNEALEQQTAISDVLRVMSDSPTDVKPVLDAVAARAARICGATDARIFLRDQDTLRHAAGFGDVAPVDVFPLNPGSASGRAVISGVPVHIHDVATASNDDYPVSKLRAAQAGWRTILAVPLMREQRALGTIVLLRRQVQPFTEKQISLLGTFADQAAIAIENVRLFNETKEALEQQTAISEVLRVISDSPTDVKPVLEAVAHRAAKICNATDARIFLVEGERLRHAAGFGDVPVSIEEFPVNRGSASGRAVVDGVAVHVHDLSAEAHEYPDAYPFAVKSGFRTILAVPLMREGRALGTIRLRRKEVRPFTEKQISLLKTFADQAAIAIENVRLFNETKEALEQQTATSEILHVISSSPTNLAPVFDAILKSATELCEAHLGLLSLYDGDKYRTVAQRGANAEYAKWVFERGPYKASGGVALMTAERRPVHIADLREGPGYRSGNLNSVKLVEVAGARTYLAVPLLKEGAVIGYLGIYRPEVRPFTEKQIALVSTFARQAVIAIDNVRLFNETKEALEQQTATAEILRVISGSLTDIQPVLDVVAANAARLCEAADAVIQLREGEVLRFVAHYGAIPNLPQGGTRTISRGLVTGRAVLEGRQIHVHDHQAEDKEYPEGSAIARQFGFHTILVTPLMRSGTAIGTFFIRRTEVKPFSEKQMALVKTFADQAVIAIENVRLFNETKEALEQQTATAEILRVITGSPTDLQPIMSAVVESAARLANADHVLIGQAEGAVIRWLAAYGCPVPPDGTPIDPNLPSGRAILERQTTQVEDVAAIAPEFPRVAQAYRELGVRSIIATPLVREGSAIGVLLLRRTNVRPFPDKQVRLLKTFADQAAIAIENVRLFNQTKEALERQTAVSQILRVISSSPGDVRPMLDAVAERAVKLCESGEAAIFLPEGEGLRFAAGCQTEETFTEDETIAVSRGSVVGRAFLDREAVHVIDLAAASVEDYPQALAYQKRFGHRSIVAVPLLREDHAIGVIALWRFEVRAFEDKHIALVRTFADQAAIAIENVRLFNETKEALEQQTATAEILRVISSSPSDLRPVFDTILDNALRLCEANNGQVYLYDGTGYDLVDFRGADAQTSEPWRRVINAGPHTGLGRILTERKPVHIPDLFDDVATRERDPMRMRTIEALGARTFLAVPLLKDQTVVGALVIYRREVRPFSDKQIALIKTFADQAVIAIENVRLFKETTEALEQQTATAEILQVISSSPTDVQPVFDAIVQSAARLVPPCKAVIVMREGNRLHWKARAEARQSPADLDELAKLYPLPLDPQRSVSAQAILERRTIYIPDTEARGISEAARLIGRAAKHRSVTVVPLLREGEGIGTIGIQHPEPGFKLTDKQVALLRTFADQAVIAIENVRLFTETKEALERQTATAEILRVISSSPTDIQPVLDAVVKSAARLCDAQNANVFRIEGSLMRKASEVGPVASTLAVGQTRAITRGSLSGRAILERRTIHVEDSLAIADEYPEISEAIRLGSIRTIVALPLLREDVPIGAITVYRNEVRPFSDAQIALLQTFADQAVIAIENVRLFRELETRNKDLTEALEQQTATGEILKVISSSPTDVQPVFDTIIRNAVRLGQAEFGTVFRVDGDRVEIGAHCNFTPEVEAYFRAQFPQPLTRLSIYGRAIMDRSVVNVADVQEASFSSESRDRARALDLRGALAVPMLHKGEAVGALAIGRQEPGEFSEAYVALLKTFADQAVIAIENVRLFNETKEALERQTATSEVLKVISQTRIDLEPVLDIVLRNARKLCGADRAIIFRADGDGGYSPAALQVTEPAEETLQFYRQHPIRPNRGSATGRALLERRPVHVPDVQADPEYRLEYAANRTYRSILAVPMLRQGEPIGVLTVSRVGEPKPFGEKQIELVASFADQAVIAIENVRLFNETTEALEQLKASAGILSVISSSVADTKPVFDAILESCERLFEGRHVGICEVGEDRKIRLSAYHGPGRADLEQIFPIPLSMESGTGAALLQRRIVHYPDIEAGPDVPPYVRKAASIMGYKSVILAPMLWEDETIGAIFVARDYVGAYSEKEIGLLKSFADQAVIAVQNARLFREIHEKSKQLEIANQHKSEFLANMSHELRTPLNAIIGFTRIVMRRAKEQLEPKQYENLEKIHSSGQHLLQLINAILDLSKVEAGRVEVNAAEVALGTVLEQCVKTVEPLVKAPAVRLVKEVDGELPQVYLDEEKLRQIVINLLSNAVKFTERGTVRVLAKCNGDAFSIAVADTGIGIPPDKLEHVFEEFAQADASSTRVYGGTGLGLTIGRRLARLMGGDISAQSAPGVGSTFTLTLPVRYDPQALAEVRTEVHARA